MKTNHTPEEFDRLKAVNAELLTALELVYSNAAESAEWIRARIEPVIAKARAA